MPARIEVKITTAQDKNVVNIHTTPLTALC